MCGRAKPRRLNLRAMHCLPSSLVPQPTGPTVFDRLRLSILPPHSMTWGS